MNDDSSNPESDQYERASAIMFSRITGPLTFDIFLQLNQQKYTRVFQQGSAIELDRLESYILKGIQYFYIPKNQSVAFLKAAAQLLDRARETGGLDQADAQSLLDETASKVLSLIFSSLQLSEENLSHTRGVIKSYVEITKPNSKAMPAVLKLAKTKPHLIRHSIMSSIFAALLARAWDPGDPKLWNLASLAAFLHDIALGHTGEKIDEHDRSLHPNIQKEIHQHPETTASILESTSLQPEVIKAILNHHENWDGTGYPQMLIGEKIPLVARIVAIAEQFSTLISDTPNGPAVAPKIAFSLLQKSNRVDPHLCAAFGKMLHFI